MKGKLSILAATLFALMMALPVSAASQDLSKTYETMRTAVIMLVIVTAVAIAVSVYLTFTLYKASKKRKSGKVRSSFFYLMVGAYVVALVCLVGTVVCGVRCRQVGAVLQNSSVTPPLYSNT